MKNIFCLILIFIMFISDKASSQTIYYQNIFRGGATGTGFSTGIGDGGYGSLTIHIPTGGHVLKAFLFSNRYHMASPCHILFNGHSFTYNEFTQIGINYYIPSFYDTNACSIHVIDVTNALNATQNIYNLDIPIQISSNSSSTNSKYGAFYLLVLYERQNLPETNVAIIINNKNQIGNVSYHITNLNPMNNTFSVGIAINSDIIGDTLSDGSYLYVNSNLLGLIGGSDAINLQYVGAGVKGCFYYENNLLYGLDDDTPNYTMGSTDGLANMSQLINNNDTHLDIDMQKQFVTTPYNIYMQYFLTYTTPCAIIPAVVSSDTAICQGQTVQLHASGETKYEWKCLTDTLPYGNSVYGLSCKTCADPVFSGDSSAVYTVRVWNGDSCSVVRPVRVTVNPKPKGVFSTVKTTCGEQKGVIKMQGNPTLQTFYAIAENGDTLQSNYQNIPQTGAGDYTAFFVDTNGCKSNDSLVTVESFSNVVADFTVTPTSGGAPLGTHITNTSQNAQNYQWNVNGQNVINPPTHFDTSGTYIIQLVAWNQHPECADTTSKTVLVFDSLIVQIPNVFSPNNDGVNDVFTLDVNLPVQVKAVILNRWGNVIYQTDQSLSVGKNDIWNGVSNHSTTVTDGTYFYRITFQLDSTVVDCNLQPCEVRKDGFVQVVR